MLKIRNLILVAWLGLSVGGNVAVAEAQTSRTKKATSGSKNTKARAKKPASPAPKPVPRFSSPQGIMQLQADLAKQASGVPGQFGIMAVSLSRGDTLFSWNPDIGLKPASTMKILTTVLAFDRLGPEHRFYTEAWVDNLPDQNGQSIGNIYLKGVGDPSLSSRWWQGGGVLPMAFLAQEIQKKGIVSISGSVLGDDTAFERRLIPDGWKTDYLGAAYAARVSALAINESLAWVNIGPRTGAKFVPDARGVMMVGNLQLVRGGGFNVRVNGRHDGVIEVNGSLGELAMDRKIAVVAPDPAIYATGVLAGQLMARGVTIQGGVALGAVPKTAVKIAAVRSPTVREIADVMNKYSVNHLAELLLRAAVRGKDETRVGSAALAQVELRQILGKMGGDSAKLFVADGSGLSLLDQITSRGMVQILDYANGSSWKGEFHNSLPVAGFEALMRRRMKNSPAEGNLHAKTGTTNNVAALAGYVTAANGELIAFSFIYNGSSRARARVVMDNMGGTLGAFRR